MEKKFAGRFTIIFGVLAVGLLGLFPPGRLMNPDLPWSKKANLKPGIDISGGTSLTYEIRAPEGGATTDLPQKVADALKRRVDPDGVKNLIWRPQPPNRLEIQMPLTEGGGVARAARQAFAEAQAQLENTNVSVAAVRAALQTPDPAQRQAALDRLAMGSARRVQLFKQLEKGLKDLDDATKSKDAVAMVDARDVISKVETDIDVTNLTAGRFETDVTVLREATDKAKKDGKPQIATQRQQELDRKIQSFKEAGDFPARAQAIDNLLQKFDAYAAVKGKVGDAEDLKRLLKGSGVLEFHILWESDTAPAEDAATADAMQKRLQSDGPTPRPNDTMRWFQVDQPEQMHGRPTYQWGGKYWALCYVTPSESMIHKEGEKPWGLSGAQQGQDPNSGQAVVNFQFDPQGAALFGELSGTHLKKPLAIVLDEKIISAPTLQSRIEGSGQISGNYTTQDLDYLIRTLNAGSLPARLADEPISEVTVGPTLGQDNLKAGLRACFFGVVAVAVFMIAYYHFAGLVAVIAVLINLLLNIGILAAFGATFTLPGIAALVLTVGMAVDANVLINERLREEQHRGLSLRLALHNAYHRAFSAILDSHVTTVCTSMLLYIFGSEEVKGFGLTLTIGIAASLFTALFVTRTIFDFCMEHFGLDHLGSLPLTFPGWDRIMRPNVDWVSKAWMFYVSSVLLIVLGLTAFVVKGREMFDVEFVSGTAVTIELKDKMPQDVVRHKLDQPNLAKLLPSPQVVMVNSTGDNVEKEYEIVTPNQDAKQVREGIMTALGDNLKVEVPSTFEMYDAKFDAAVDKVVVPVTGEGMLVDGFSPPSVIASRDGVAIILRNLSPAIAPRDIQQRIERVRLEPGSNVPFRKIQIDSPLRDQDKPTTLAVVFVTDPSISYEKDPTEWRSQLASPTWNLVISAVGRPAELRGVTNFNPQVAISMVVDASIAVTLSIVAIALYLAFRFGNFVYGSATIVALIHDVLISIGFIGLSQYLGQVPFLRDYLLIEPLRMNLVVVAAVLTVMGYSVSDTIIVFDRIRENRGKFGHVSRQLINDSINQTLSRTILTVTTTMLSILAMYIWGGPGIHGFTYALLFGILVGTYSSVAIAAPILLMGKKNKAAATQPKSAGNLQRVVGQ